MRVGMICPYSLSVPGGVQVQVLGLARALRERGVDVRVLGPCDGPPPEPGITPLGNSLPTAANGSMAPLAPDISAQLRTIRAVWEEDFDVIHLHEPFAPGPTVTTLLLRPGPMIATFHAAGSSAGYKWLNRGCRSMLGRLHLTCAVSADAEKMVREALGGSFERVFNGVEIDRFVGAKQWPTEGPTVFFLGRHEERKGLEVLLRAVRELPENVRVWVASDGPQTPGLKAAYGDDRRIEWLGRVTEAEKVERLAGADVFCAPSLRGESFGVVLLEAMAAETAIVASDLPGYANVAEQGRHALLVPPGDASQLAAALRAVLFGSVGPDLVAAGIDRAEQFSMDRLAERYIELYEQLLASSLR